MVSMTLAVPKDLKVLMDRHPDINWSETARQAIRNRIEMLERMDKIFANSKLTIADTIRIGRKINRGIAKRHREYYLKHL